jgi:hypothetical protein
MSNLDDSDIISEIDQRIQVLKQKLHIEQTTAILRTVEDLEQFELTLSRLNSELSDLAVARKLQQTWSDPEFRHEVNQFTSKHPLRLKNHGLRKVKIRFLSGTVVLLKACYFVRNCDLKKRGKGLFPGLLMLGIHDHCSPVLASEICIASAALCSLDEAQHMMENRGCKLNIKTIRNITKRFAARARLCQKGDTAPDFWKEENVKGRRVVVSTDGGRVRIRKKKRGPKTKKGHNRFSTDWKEPKLLIIYVATKDGRQDKQISPLLDGTMEGPDTVFAMIKYYLEKLNIGEADSVLFVADGAKWIWERTKKLFKDLCLKADQIHELIDFYHASEHLSELAKLKKDWSDAERKKWVKKNRKQLKDGNIDIVIESIKKACKGTKNNLLRREKNYFINNELRMQYADVAKKGLPIGSGAIESSIRRVINLRLKGACIYWNIDTANEMIMMRSFYKAKRWNMLREMSFMTPA